jgi:hypothetical protein
MWHPELQVAWLGLHHYSKSEISVPNSKLQPCLEIGVGPERINNLFAMKLALGWRASNLTSDFGLRRSHRSGATGVSFMNNSKGPNSLIVSLGEADVRPFNSILSKSLALFILGDHSHVQCQIASVRVDAELLIG